MSDEVPLGMRIALVGASGWLGRSIGPSILTGGVVAPGDLVCVSRSGRTADYAKWPQLRWETEVEKAVAVADAVILSIRPQHLEGGAFRCEGRLVVSLLAGVTCDEVSARTGATRIIRAMPNAAVEIGRSYSPFFANKAATQDDRRLTRAVLGAVGTSDEIESEEAIDVITALSGTGPAYPALLASALFDAACEAGLSPDIAAKAVEATICDASGLLRGRGNSADKVVESFIQYRGTTAEVLTAARSAGFDHAISRALQAGIEKARKPRE